MRTYIPGAVTTAQVTHKYLTRYQAKLTAGASPNQIVALTELISCLAQFLNNWFKTPPT